MLLTAESFNESASRFSLGEVTVEYIGYCSCWELFCAESAVLCGTDQLPRVQDAFASNTV